MATTPEAVEVHWWWSHKYFIHPSGIQSELYDERRRNETQIERNSREFCFHSQNDNIELSPSDFFSSRIRFQSVFIYTIIIAERMPFIKRERTDKIVAQLIIECSSNVEFSRNEFKKPFDFQSYFDEFVIVALLLLLFFFVNRCLVFKSFHNQMLFPYDGLWWAKKIVSIIV